MCLISVHSVIFSLNFNMAQFRVSPWILVTWCLTFLLGAGDINALPAGGNAMDLAQMNMNMMNSHSNCHMLPCQTACLVRNKETGCYVCNSACQSGGNGMGMPNMGTLGSRIVEDCDSRCPLTMCGLCVDSNGMFGCISGAAWIQCHHGCTKELDKHGCYNCNCENQTRMSQTDNPERSTSIPTTAVKSRQSPSRNSIPTQMTSSVRNSETKTTVWKGQTSPSHLQTVSPPLITRDKGSRTITPNNPSLTSTRSTPSAATFQTEHAIDNGMATTTANNMNVYSGSSNTTTEVEYLAKPNESADKTHMIVMYVLATLLVISLTLTTVFFVAWRKTRRKLRKNKNELYFVEKAFRQDSVSPLTTNIPEPVYAHVSQPPEVPPRTPPISPSSPLSPTAPYGEFLFRTLSVHSDTPLKEPTTTTGRITPHDYMELI